MLVRPSDADFTRRRNKEGNWELFSTAGGGGGGDSNAQRLILIVEIIRILVGFSDKVELEMEWLD